MTPRPTQTDNRRSRWAPSAAWLGLILLVAPAPLAAIEPVTDFGANPGNLRMFLHRPAETSSPVPLVVALHGCTQNAADFDDETGLLALAEETPFLLLLPEQREENMARRCFRWYDADHNRAGVGESASILAMIDHVLDTHDVDPDRVFVLGLSAGGAMTAVLMANYPDRFAGGAVLAGLPFDCNRPASIFDGTWYWLHYNAFAPDGADASYACGVAGFSATDRDADDWAAFVLDTLPARPEAWPLVSLWQGTGDTTVDPENLGELAEQWTAVQGIDAVPDDREETGGAVHQVYRDAAGRPRVETWLIEGFAHAVPIDADGDPETCGTEGRHVIDADICAVRRIAEFWQLK